MFDVSVPATRQTGASCVRPFPFRPLPFPFPFPFPLGHPPRPIRPLKQTCVCALQLFVFEKTAVSNTKRTDTAAASSGAISG